MKRLFNRIDWEKVMALIIIILVNAFLIGGFITLLCGCATMQPVGPYVDCVTVKQTERGGVWVIESDTSYKDKFEPR